MRKALPHGFAPRTAEIQKGIEEARKASAEANARLSEIEVRLSKLDADIATIRSAAEADFSVEEQRIKDCRRSKMPRTSSPPPSRRLTLLPDSHSAN